MIFWLLFFGPFALVIPRIAGWSVKAFLIPYLAIFTAAATCILFVSLCNTKDVRKAAQVPFDVMGGIADGLSGICKIDDLEFREQCLSFMEVYKSAIFRTGEMVDVAISLAKFAPVPDIDNLDPVSSALTCHRIAMSVYTTPIKTFDVIVESMLKKD